LAKTIVPQVTDIAVIGLGRFGSAVATSLCRLGHDVVAIDCDAELVQQWAAHLTHVVQADATDPEALRRLGIDRFRHAIVAIGEDVEASVLTVLALSEVGVPDIWAKALQERHGRILERTGAHHVIYPEMKMGERVAHLITGKVVDFIEFEDGFAIVKTRAPAEAFGRSLGDCKLRSKYGVMVVGVKRPQEDFTYATADTVIERGDLLIVSGPTVAVETFAAIT
jgi:trk system potassium uptake protein